MKTCTKCSKAKPVELFYKQPGGDGYRAACKACHAAAGRRQCERGGEALKAKRAKAVREKRRSDPEYRLRQALRTFNLTPDEFRAMEKDQGGACAICEQPETDKRNHRLAVDHCHKHGHVRGLLCKSCNIGLGMFNDDANNLQRASDYLARTTP